MATLVVGYDGSDGGRAALKAAADLASALGDEVHVVMAYDVKRVGGEVADYARALRERAERVVELARDQAAGLGFQIETEIVEEDPAKALVDTADRLSARLIVVGTRGESPLRGAFVGSTPHKLLQVAGRPVLVVPA